MRGISGESVEAGDDGERPGARCMVTRAWARSAGAGRRHRAGAQVFRHGDAAGHVVFIESGSVFLQRVERNGVAVAIARREPGALVGLASVIARCTACHDGRDGHRRRRRRDPSRAGGRGAGASPRRSPPCRASGQRNAHARGPLRHAGGASGARPYRRRAARRISRQLGDGAALPHDGRSDPSRRR